MSFCQSYKKAKQSCSFSHLWRTTCTTPQIVLTWSPDINKCCGAVETAWKSIGGGVDGGVQQHLIGQERYWRGESGHEMGGGSENSNPLRETVA